MVSCWLSVYHLGQPDVLIVDHAPTALLAAQIVGIPVLQIGTGFVIPPDVCPFPSIRLWEKILNKRLLQADTRALETINHVCTAYKKPHFDTLQACMRYGIKLITSFVELDHYGYKRKEIYTGPILTNSIGIEKPCFETERPVIFAYLRTSIPGYTALLNALVYYCQFAEITLVIPGIKTKSLKLLTSKGIRVYPRAIKLDYYLAKANLAITYGNYGTVSQFLLSGIPVLLVPQNIEQYLLSQRVEHLGAGLMAGHQRSVQDFTDLLSRLLEESSTFQQQATLFAKQYQAFSSQQVVTKIVAETEALL